MKIIKSGLPSASILNTMEEGYDYVDGFQGNFTDRNGTITAVAIGRLFFTSGPKWIDRLFTLRNRFVQLFGLKTSGKITNRQKMLEDFNWNKGERLGLFKVFDKTANEIVLGEDDKHLNFRVSLFIDRPAGDNTNKKLIISTTVKFHHWLGRLYFLPVKPFHQLIVPAMLRGIIKNIELQNSACNKA